MTLGKNVKLTPWLSIFGEVQYDTPSRWKGDAGLTYLVSKNISLIGKWHSEYGGGGEMRFGF